VIVDEVHLAKADELKTILAEMTYPKVVEQQSVMSDNLQKIEQKIPMLVFVG
jgi:hypothetical protein